MGEHVGVEDPYPGELVLVLPGDLVEKGALHVDHLIMAHGEHEVLREGVHKGEGQVPVVVLPEVGVQLDVVGHIVHPAHVPLQVEAQTSLEAALAHGLGDAGPGGGLLRDHENVGVGTENGGIQLLEEVHRLQVLVAAE